MLLLLAGWGLSGCRHPGASGSQGAGAAAEDAYWSESAVEQRTRGHAHFAAGVLTDLEDKEEAALRHFYEAALADLDHQDLLIQVAGRLLQARQTERAIGLLERGCARPGATARLHAWLGLAWSQQGNLEAAARANEAALALDPRFLMAYQNLVAIHTERREPARVLEVVRRAAAQSSDHPAFYVEVAELCSAHGRLHPEDAAAVKPLIQSALDRAAALQPKDPLVAHRLAEGFRRAGEWERAESVYRDLLKQSPGAPLVRESLAEIYLQANQPGKAQEELRSILRANPANERATYVLGALALQDGRFPEAEELLQRALLLQPLLEPAYYDLAAARLSLDQPEQALETLDRARTLFRPTFTLEFYTAMARVRTGEFREALRRFEEAERLATAGDPERLTKFFHFQHGAAAERAGERDVAARLFHKALDLDPDFAEALNYLGYMWAERGENLDEARQLIERAVQREPDNAAFLDSLAWVLFRQGEAAAALAPMEKAVAKSAEPDATLFDHLGDILQALGRTEEARRAWRESLKLQPSEEVERKLEAPAPGPGP